jgi:ribose transport system substrate-binding protein
MLCGNLPHKDMGKGLVSSIYQSLEEPPIPPREWRPEISEATEAVILKAIDKSPARRFENANEMARALNRSMGRPSDIHHIEGPPTLNLARDVRDSLHRMARAKQRRYVLPVVAIVAVLIVVVAMLLGRDETVEFGPPLVLDGETGIAADIIPSRDEIARADQRLGQSGFLGLIACNTSSQYHATQAREIADFARAYGLSVRVYDPDSDAYQQVTELETARAQGAQGLFICALDFDLLNAPLRDAEMAGIPMVFLHGDTPNYGGVRVVSDNYQMGRVPGLYAGQLVADELAGQAQVITLDYPEIDDVVIRANGMEDGLLEEAPNAQLVGRYIGGTRAFGEDTVQSLLEDGVEFDVILSINDAGAYGAIAALEAAGYEGHEVIIVSVDAEDLAKHYIEDEHFMRASVSVGRTEAARGAVDAMVKLLAGSPVPVDILAEPGSLFTGQPEE